MAALRNIVWNTAMLALFLIIYHFGTSFTFVVVDEDLRYMEPTLMPSGMHVLDRRPSRIATLGRDAVIAFNTTAGKNGKPKRMFARVLATAGMTVSTRDGRFLVDGADVSKAAYGTDVLRTGLIVPRGTVFIVLDSQAGAPALSLQDRIVPLRNILGRVRGT